MRTRLAVAGVAIIVTLPLFAGTSSRDRMFADLEVLCGAALGGRVSLSPGADGAAQYLAEEMRRARLSPASAEGYLQRFDVVPVRLDREASAVVVRRHGQERRFAPASVSFPDPTRAVDLDLEVVFAGYGITAPELGYDDYAGLDVRGRAVLVFDHEPREADPRSPFHGAGFTLHANAWTKTRNAEQHGAAAVLVATEPNAAHRSAARAARRANAPPQALAAGALRIPRFTIPQDALAALLDGTGRTPGEWQQAIDGILRPASRDLPGVRVWLRAVNAETSAASSSNVAGLLEGADPARRHETILVTSHYDHLGEQDGSLYPGANDNASGTVVMLEAARLLAARRPARSVLFVSFGSEEQLMLGSYHYAAHPLRPLETTRAVLNLDMVGRNEEHTPESLGGYDVTAGRADQLNVVGAAFSPDLTAVLARAAARTGMTLSDKFDRDSSMRALFRCDHLPFLQHGVPAVWLFGGFHPGYHEPVDTVDRLDPDKLARVLDLTVEAARTVADAETAPRFAAPTVSQPSEAAAVVAPGATLEKLAGGFAFTEGPTSDAQGHVFFTDQPNDRILKWSTDGRLSTFLQPAGRANGMFFDARGQLIACADEKNELWSIAPDGTRAVLAADFEGKKLNGPNDVWVGPDGSLFFTDPFYKRPWWDHDQPPQGTAQVYWLSADRRTIRRVTSDLVKPNGIVGTPDGRTLYVADIGAGLTYAFDIGADGTLTNRRVFCERGSDGMTLDAEGHLYLTGRGVMVFDRTGAQVGQIDVPEAWTANVSFGGRDHRTLFVTASTGLYAIRMKHRGANAAK